LARFSEAGPGCGLHRGRYPWECKCNPACTLLLGPPQVTQGGPGMRPDRVEHPAKPPANTPPPKSPPPRSIPRNNFANTPHEKYLCNHPQHHTQNSHETPREITSKYSPRKATTKHRMKSLTHTPHNPPPTKHHPRSPALLIFVQTCKSACPPPPTHTTAWQTVQAVKHHPMDLTKKISRNITLSAQYAFHLCFVPMLQHGCPRMRVRR